MSPTSEAILALSSQVTFMDLRDEHKEAIVDLLDKAAAQLDWAVMEAEMHTPEELEAQDTQRLLRQIFDDQSAALDAKTCAFSGEVVPEGERAWTVADEKAFQAEDEEIERFNSLQSQ